MKSVSVLPEGYGEILHIDLQKDNKLALIVNGLALVIMVAMIAAAAFFVPLSTLFDYKQPLQMLLKAGVLVVGSILYIILHEAVHGIFMRRYCDAKVKFGFTGLYAFAGSEGYYCRKHYIVIALAPIVVWGVVLGILNVLVPAPWFYVVYILQVTNISGAAGDLYVSWRMNKLPKDILVKDTGVAMTVYSKEGARKV